ncbi:MAG: hypothetical protein RIQ78_1742, partial [Bacteroidota bacterium]
YGYNLYRGFESRFLRINGAFKPETESLSKVLKDLFRDVAQPGSAPALGAGGPRFESWYPDNKTTQLSVNQAVAFVF